MGLLDWLFGRTPAARSEPEPPASRTWHISENGNPTMLLAGGGRLTVFESDDGWKFCASQRDGDRDAFFSESYMTAEAAKDEALAFVTGAPSRHASIAETYRQEGRARYAAKIDEKAELLIKLRKELEESDLNVTKLRKIEAKLATQVRQVEWQIDELHRRGVDKKVIMLAEHLGRDFPKFLATVAERIAGRKKRRTK